MLPTINPYDKLPEIKIYILNSQYQTIGRVKEAQDKQYTTNVRQLNELQFVIPLYIDDIDNGIQKNPHADMLIDHAIVKVKYGRFQELFVIDNHEDSDDERKRTIHAFSLGFQLGSRYLTNYKTATSTTVTDASGNSSLQDIPAPITIDKALHDAVNTSMIWSVGYIDNALMSLYRYFEYTSTSALQFIYDIGTTYNCIIVWDTINQQVSAYHPDNYGVDRGFKISDKKYLSALSKKTSDDQFATRLYLYGKDGITINSISATGSSYIDDFTYFMANGLMSQDLINALNSYYAYVDSRKTEFPNLLSQLNSAESTMTTLSTTLSDLQNQKTIITNNLDVLNASGDRKDFTYTFTTSATESDTFTAIPPENRIVLFDITQIGAGNAPTMTINGTAIPYVSGTTTYCAKFTGNCNFVVTNSNTTTTTIAGMLLHVSDADYALSTADLITKYSQSTIDGKIAAQQTQVNNQQTTINGIQSQITTLSHDLDIANHLTTSQLKEFDGFIIEKEYTDDNCTDAQSLLDSGQTQMKERNQPDIQFSVSLFNFLNSLEEKRNWNNIALFDIVHIQSYNIDVDITARIVTMQIDDNNINLTIANTKNTKDEQDKFIQMLYGTVNSNKALQKKEFSWDSAATNSNQFIDYLNSAIDATKQKIIAGINQTVDIGTRGIKVMSADNPDTFLLINNGVIGITKNGGQTWDNALTTDGLIAEKIIGTMIVSSKLAIVNDTGTFTIDQNGLIGTKADNTVRTVIDETNGIKIQASADNGVTWTDKLFISTSGVITANGLLINDNTGGTALIDGNTKTIDFSKFNTILGTLQASNITIGSGTNFASGYDPSTKATVNDLGYYITLSNESQSILTDINGATKSSVTITTSIDTFKGQNRIASTIGTVALKDSNGNIISSSGVTFTISNPTATGSGSISITINSGVNFSVDAGYFEIPITVETTNYTKRLTWNKAKDGASGQDAKFVIVTGEQVFKFPSGASTPSNTSIVLTGTVYGLTSATYQWQYWNGTSWSNSIKTGYNTTSYTVAYNDSEWGTKASIRYRCLVNNSYTDEITIVKLYDGAAGSSALTVILTNETTVVPTDSSGGNGNYAGSGTDIYLYEGVNPVLYDGLGTSNNSWKVSASGTNITPSTTFTDQGNYVTIGNHSNMTQDTASIVYTITGKRADGTAISLTKTQTFSKAKQGTTGVGAKVADIIASSQIFKTQDGGVTYTPSTITLNPFFQNTSFSNWQYSTDAGSTWTTAVSGTHGITISTNVLTLANSSDLFNGITTVIFKLNAIDSGVADTISVVKLFDVNGTYIDQNGVYTHTIQFDQAQGGTLTLGGVGNGNGQMVVLDGNGEVIANLDSSQGGFNSLYVGNFSSPTVPGYNVAAITYYIDPAGSDDNDGLTTTTPLLTIQAAIDKIPKVNNGDITILCKAPPTNTRQDYFGDVTLWGISGRGQIVIDGQNWWNYINGRVRVEGCSARVFIKNFTINYTNDTSGSGIAGYACTYLYCSSIYIYGQNKAIAGFYADQGTNMYLQACEAYNVTHVIDVQHRSDCFVSQCKGLGNSYGLVAQWGSWIMVYSTYPSGTTAATYTDTAGTISLNSGTTNGGATGTTTVPIVQTTKQFTQTSVNSWSEYYSTWANDGYARQGKYGTTVGNYRGCWFFGTQILDAIGTGKTIKSIRVYIQRSSSAGQSSGVTHFIRAHGYATQPAGAPTMSGLAAQVTLGWGQGAWVNIDPSFFAGFASGSYRGVAIWTSDGSNYTRCQPACTIEVTYQ